MSSKIYNREFEYRKYRFNVKVELFWKAERHIGGEVWHQITVNDMGVTNYYRTYLAPSDKLEEMISSAEDLAKTWVDDREGEKPVAEEIKLEALGFVKQ